MTHNDSKTLTLPYPAAELVPHQSPMLFLDMLTERSADRTTAAATMSMDGKYFFKDQGNTPCPEFFIEIIAQTIAAARGYDSLVDGSQPKTGLLVGFDEIAYEDRQLHHCQLNSQIQKIFKLGEITLFEGKLFGDQLPLVSGKMQVWEQS